MGIFKIIIITLLISIGIYMIYSTKKRKEDKNVFKICKIVEERRLKDKDMYIKTACKYQMIQGISMIILGVLNILEAVYSTNNLIFDSLMIFSEIAVMTSLFMYFYKIYIRVDKFYV